MGLYSFQRSKLWFWCFQKTFESRKAVFAQLKFKEKAPNWEQTGYHHRSVADEVLNLNEKLTHTVCSCGRDLLVSSCPHPETYRTSLSLNMMLHSVRPETTVTDTINVSTECLLLYYISWTSGLFSHSFNTIRLQPEASPPPAIVWLYWVCIIVWYEVEWSSN